MEKGPDNTERIPDSDELIERYLTYQDVSPKEQNAESKVSESERKYAESLQSLAKTHGLKNVERVASRIKTEMKDAAAALNMPLTKYAESKSWAMWDIAKQHYFAEHPAENDPRYRIAEPMTDADKQSEIRNRHLAWEAHTAYKHQKWGPKEVPESFKKEVERMLAQQTKPDEQLTSAEFAALGAVLYKAALEKMAERSAPRQSESPLNMPEAPTVAHEVNTAPPTPRPVSHAPAESVKVPAAAVAAGYGSWKAGKMVGTGFGVLVGGAAMAFGGLVYGTFKWFLKLMATPWDKLKSEAVKAVQKDKGHDKKEAHGHGGGGHH